MKKSFANTLTFLFILTMAGCNLPSKGSLPPIERNDTSTLIPVLVTPSPTLTPEPLPVSYVELLLNKIEAGEWTLEAGLVTMLKLFAGEIQPNETNFGHGVLESEGTGILLEAGDYLRTGTDPAVKEELKRLMNILVPTQEALNQYSIPEAQASNTNIKLAALIQEGPEECGSFWSLGFPDRRMGAYACFLYGEQNLGGNLYRVYFPQAWYGDSSRKPYYSAVQKAIEESVVEFQKYGELLPMYFVFNTLSSPQNFLAEVSLDFRPGEEACPVIIYPISLNLDIDFFKQSIAHEIFHCFQILNLKEQFTGRATFSRWWMEGTAEYFSNVVYPFVDHEDRFAESLSQKSTYTAITQMDYENYAFFQFLGNQNGVGGVMEMIRNYITSVPDTDAQLASLASVPGMEATFEEFVRSVIDNTLIDSSTAPIIFPVKYTNNFTFNDISSVDFAAQPFVAARYLITFEKEKKYTVESFSVGQGISALRPRENTGDWRPIPPTIASGCYDMPYVLYVITTTPRVERKETVSTTLVADSPCDICLIGRWEATNDSILTYMQSTNSNAGENGMIVDGASGEMFMEFSENGTGSGGYEYLKIHQSGKGSSIGTEVLLTFNGITAGAYSADGTTLTGLSGIGEIFVTVDVIINGASLGSSTNPIRPQDFPVSPTVSTRYTCEGDVLTSWPPIEGTIVDPIIWKRVNQ